MGKQSRIKPSFFGILTAFLLLLPLPSAFGAEEEQGLFSRVPDQDWQKTFQLMQNRHNPLAQKLMTWLYVTETNIPADLSDLIHFSLENSSWPKLHEFRARVEKGIGSSKLRPVQVAAWFDQAPPRSVKGFGAYMEALSDLHHDHKGKSALRKFWLEAALDKKETARLADDYRLLFSPTDHVDRLDRLLWDQRYQEAEYMLPLVDDGSKKLALARTALGRVSSNASKLVHAVPAALQNDSGFLFDRMRWRRLKDKDNDAFDILKQAPKDTTHADLWWKERNILARRALEKGDPGRAYKIVQGHGLEAGIEYSQAEWLLGWLSLRFQHKPDKAYQHFDHFYQAVNSAISRARAAYWLARAAEAMHQKQSAENWDKLGAQFPSTFYGQLCHEKVYGPVDAAQFLDDQASPDAQKAFEEKELVRAIKLLARTGLRKYADAFFIKLLDKAQERTDFVLIAQLAREVGRPYFAVEANKQLQQKLGDFMYTEGYPLLPSMPSSQPESSLTHAIVHRESMFDTAAQSSAGARGLMQLMPGTARQVSRKIGQKYTPGKLTDNPQYNVVLGSAYLQGLLNDYEGFYPLAIAAYNAGPNNVNQWIKEFGDPRNPKVNVIDWIEMIPFYETRNYVQRVMESYYIYKLKLSEPPKTVLGFGRG